MVEQLILPPPTEPMAVARELLAEFQLDELLTLRSWRGSWTRWATTHWQEVEPAAVRSAVDHKLENALYIAGNPPKMKPWAPTRPKVANVLDAIAAISHLPETTNPPTWMEKMIPAATVVSCANGLLDITSRQLIDHSPAFFNVVAVPFPFDPTAQEPTRWLRFLDQLWPNDPDPIRALQEWFGYVVSGRTDLQKIMLMIGPTRSGKGTIARVLAAMVGRGNVAGPTLASLQTNFGLSPLLGKTLAVISDARLGGGTNVPAVVERLLSISGEDLQTVDRKYREPWTGKLPTRFMIISNELPRFGDASGAIANRFVVTSMNASWLGRENPRLTSELLAELPGILRWALDGLDRLSTSDTFTQPAASTDAILALQDLVSPVAAFVRDRCQVGVGYGIKIADLYTGWRTWCEENGHRPGSHQTFGRDLRAVIPTLRVVRPRDDEVNRERRYAGVTLRE